MDQANSPQAIVACHDLLAWIIPQLDKFPRVRRFTLGERIETGLLDVLEQLLNASYSRGQAKATALHSASLHLISFPRSETVQEFPASVSTAATGTAGILPANPRKAVFGASETRVSYRSPRGLLTALRAVAGKMPALPGAASRSQIASFTRILDQSPEYGRRPGITAWLGHLRYARSAAAGATNPGTCAPPIATGTVTQV